MNGECQMMLTRHFPRFEIAEAICVKTRRETVIYMSIYFICAAAVGALVGLALLLGDRSTSNDQSPNTNCQNVVLTKHALLRMGQRSVLEEEILKVVADPELRACDSDHRSIRLERKVGQGVLIVWVVDDSSSSGPTIVKTTAWKDLVQVIEIPLGSKSGLIGLKGSNCKRITQETGAMLFVDERFVRIRAKSFEALELAASQIEFHIRNLNLLCR